MHPLNKKYFGEKSGSIAVSYNPLTAFTGTVTPGVATGYIVRQLGTSKFVVTTDGVNTFPVVLDAHCTNPADLQPGHCTIAVTPMFVGGNGPVEYAARISEGMVVTVQGNRYEWRLGTGGIGQSNLAHIPTEILTGVAAPQNVVAGAKAKIDGVAVTFAAGDIPSVVAEINAAHVPHVTAKTAPSGAVVLTDADGHAITLVDGNEQPLADLGFTADLSAVVLTGVALSAPVATGSTFTVNGATVTIATGDVNSIAAAVNAITFAPSVVASVLNNALVLTSATTIALADGTNTPLLSLGLLNV